MRPAESSLASGGGLRIISLPLEEDAASTATNQADDLVARLIRDSPLKSEAAKEVLARAVETLHRQLGDLRAKVLRGDIRAEEAKTIPAVASNLKRLCDTLGVTVPVEEGDEPL